ncbi:iron-hydroxamate ABC transporter substrate-binding protein [Brevibacillus humidisoli]|uniref:iron-hydroxamate ABC transporter substrate-binding protein n=1 Tax=Brevibacillus humidisoli TaxID=2895522 RepID=UPI001E57ED97|nr:iron-hydroxamate ABC transporter substrate-binding protein [Brevibacillus humidisoli]UFJ39444.1 iron-hydroxamate ABC transporter substrate-binding protein [Brevibacillus humidisoli]
MKRQNHHLWKICCLILLLGVLSACGTSAVQPSGSSTDAEPASENEETVLYQAANGEVRIPKNPERIVVLADSYVGYFLALGIKPVGATDHALQNPYFQGMTDGIENLGDGKSVEKILELQPDLIITFSGVENIGKLEKIAATVAVEYGKTGYREQLREFGKMTGREEQANEWIAEWDRKLAEQKQKVTAAVGDQTVSILSPYAKGIYAYGHNYARGGEILYLEFQLKAPELIQQEAIDSGQGWVSLSLERLPDYAGDYIFTCDWSGDDADPSAVYDSSIWQGLPAVQNDRVFQIDPIAAYFNDPISLEKHLEFIVEKLTQ